MSDEPAGYQETGGEEDRDDGEPVFASPPEGQKEACSEDEGSDFGGDDVEASEDEEGADEGGGEVACWELNSC